MSSSEHQPVDESMTSPDAAVTVNPPAPSTPHAATSGHWLHPSSVLFDAISNGRQNLVPAVIALLTAAGGSMFWMYLAIAIFGASLLRSVLRYVTLRYRIENGELTVREGLIFKRVRTVPLERIQNIDLTQNVLHRMLGVAEVRVETAGGKEPEATLRVLSLDKVTRLREAVFSQRPAKSIATESADAEKLVLEEVLPDVETITLHEIPFKQIIQAGIASNRGIVVFGVLIGIFFQFDLEKRFKEYLDFLFELVPKDLGVLNTVISVLAGLLLIFVVTRVYGAIWYLLRFYGYRLTLHNNDFRISCGLFTKVSATVPRKRIQFISVHQSLFMRWFGLSSIRIETAGGAGQDNEDAASSVGRRWFIPIISQSKVESLLPQLRPGLNWEPEQADWIGVSSKTARRLCRLAVIQSLGLAIVGFAIARPWGWIAGVVALPIFVYWAIRKSRAMRYTETDFGVVYRSGVFTKKLSLTFFDRIQTLRFDQSPFDRRWKMATLSVDTAAAGPADHRVHVKYLDETIAKSRYEALSKRLEIQKPALVGPS